MNEPMNHVSRGVGPIIGLPIGLRRLMDVSRLARFLLRERAVSAEVKSLLRDVSWDRMFLGHHPLPINRPKRLVAIAPLLHVGVFLQFPWLEKALSPRRGDRIEASYPPQWQQQQRNYPHATQRRLLRTTKLLVPLGILVSN